MEPDVFLGVQLTPGAIARWELDVVALSDDEFEAGFERLRAYNASMMARIRENYLVLSSGQKLNKQEQYLFIAHIFRLIRRESERRMVKYRSVAPEHWGCVEVDHTVAMPMLILTQKNKKDQLLSAILQLIYFGWRIPLCEEKAVCESLRVITLWARRRLSADVVLDTVVHRLDYLEEKEPLRVGKFVADLYWVNIAAMEEREERMKREKPVQEKKEEEEEEEALPAKKNVTLPWPKARHALWLFAIVLLFAYFFLTGR